MSRVEKVFGIKLPMRAIRLGHNEPLDKDEWNVVDADGKYDSGWLSKEQADLEVEMLNNYDRLKEVLDKCFMDLSCAWKTSSRKKAHNKGDEK